MQVNQDTPFMVGGKAIQLSAEMKLRRRLKLVNAV